MASAILRRLGDREVSERIAELSDDGLLERYLVGNEATAQEAFGALVQRHGPMVLGICRHILDEEHDAEDAFQATFLVLARKGGTIRNRTVLAGWLHEVAHRIANKARAGGARRRTLERQAMAMSPTPNEPNRQAETAAWNELRPILHDEVAKLPEKYRLPVILCYLEGKTNEEAAAVLDWPVGTVKGRLSRARDVLRSRLLRRGLALSAGFLLTAFAQRRVFAEVVPAELLKSTVMLARKFRAGRGLLGEATMEPVSTGGSDLPAELTQFSRGVNHLKNGRRLFFWLLVFFVVFSTSVAMGLAATIRGGLGNGPTLSVPLLGGGAADIASANAESFAGAPVTLGESPHCDR
jgi:RNA polymerase sigma factor (sigma-70 family)